MEIFGLGALALAAMLCNGIIPLIILMLVYQSYKEIKASNARLSSAVNRLSDLRIRELERQLEDVEQKLDRLLAEKEEDVSR